MSKKKTKEQRNKDMLIEKSKIPDLQSILLKEYELCFTRASTVYDLTNDVIKLYTTIFFAVMSVFGFAFNSTYSTIFNSTKVLPVSLLLGLIIYGISTLFMHIATWSARNFYRKRRSLMQKFLFGLYEDSTPKEAILKYICLPRYVNSGVLHSLSLYLWYFLYLILCNWIAVILLSSILFNTFTPYFYIVVGSFLPLEWIMAEWQQKISKSK